MSKKPYKFTAADRKRATESRAKNKARKERAWQIAEGEEEVASWDVLNSLYAIALDGGSGDGDDFTGAGLIGF